MVLFDSDNSFVNAIDTAISMNSVSRYVINEHLKRNEVACGIGIDYGKMLATKTGIRRHGNEQRNYQNLVWLGKPANIASKLTDIAYKPAESVNIPAVSVARGSSNWKWRPEWCENVVSGFKKDYISNCWRHDDPSVESFIMSDVPITIRAKTPPILMTKTVYDGFKAARPRDPSVLARRWEKVEITVPEYSDQVYGGDVVWKLFGP